MRLPSLSTRHREKLSACWILLGWKLDTIELLVTLDDGRAIPLQVRAADKACWAAERFLQDHGLDLGLKDDLAKYLTQIEDDAESFPVHQEARLSDITCME